MTLADAGPAERPLFLVGFMASGKSTVGRLVAARLGWAFRDLDEMIVEAAGGRTVAEVFAAEGEAGFRTRGAEALRAATALRRTVIATGGGAACREDNLVAMLAAGAVVGLEVSADEVLRRVGGRSTRPLLASSVDPRATALALLRDREPFYARAHARVETDGRTPDQVAAAVLRVLEARAS